MAKKIKFKGVGVVNPTPFDSKDRFDAEEFKRHLDFMVEAGVNVINLTAACGEGMKLSEEEHKLVLKTAVDHLNGRAYVLAYPTRLSVIETVRVARQCEDLGANGIKLMTLPYWVAQPAGVYETYKAIIESIKIDVVLYNNIPRTNVNLSVSTVKRLAEEYPEQVVGIKEGNFSQVKDLVAGLKDTRPEFKIMAAGVNDLIPTMALGGHGMITLLACVAPKLAVDIYESCVAGDFVKARELYYDNKELIDLTPARLIGDTNPRSVKYMLNLMGWNMGKPRLPDTWPPSPENQATYKKVLDKFGLLKGDNNPQ